MRPKKKKFLIDLAWNYLLFSGSSRKKLLQQLLVCTCIRMLVRNWAASRLTERQTRHKETRKENQILYIAYFFKFKYLVSHFGKSRAASSLENVGGDGREKNLGKGGGGLHKEMTEFINPTYLPFLRKSHDFICYWLLRLFSDSPSEQNSQQAHKVIHDLCVLPIYTTLSESERTMCMCVWELQTLFSLLPGVTFEGDGFFHQQLRFTSYVLRATIYVVEVEIFFRLCLL